MHLHRLVTGHPVLRRKLRDPLTRKLLAPGDEIVVCAHCKRAFLASSWLSMQSMDDHGHRGTLASLEALLPPSRLDRTPPSGRRFVPQDGPTPGSGPRRQPGSGVPRDERFRVRSRRPAPSVAPPAPPGPRSAAPAGRPLAPRPLPAFSRRPVGRSRAARSEIARWAIGAAVAAALLTLLLMLL